MGSVHPGGNRPPGRAPRLPKCRTRSAARCAPRWAGEPPPGSGLTGPLFPWCWGLSVNCPRPGFSPPCPFLLETQTMSLSTWLGRRNAPKRTATPKMELLEDRCVLSGDPILHWNAIALDTEKADYTLGHTPDQGGPTPDSRALAIVHAAMFDAVNSIDGRFSPYLIMAPDAKGASIDAAVAQAAHDTLSSLYPSQQASLDAALADTLAGIPDGKAETRGIAVGQTVAAAILAARADDGSDVPMDYHPISKPGHHQPDPLHPDQGFL